jgi:uncharacterized protein involved in type VI secretion and phage assembly
MITAAQCRAARAWLNLTQADLAEMIGRDLSVVRRFETEGYSLLAFSLMLRETTGEALQRVFEERGIKFLEFHIVGQRGVVGPE